jgi:hypothetical protein
LNTFGNGREVERNERNYKIREEYPGPASYNHIYPGNHAMGMGISGRPGYSFALDDPASRHIDPSKQTPGPGNYDPTIRKNTNAKTFNSGPEKGAALKDNGVPGPDAYPADTEDMAAIREQNAA